MTSHKQDYGKQQKRLENKIVAFGIKTNKSGGYFLTVHTPQESIMSTNYW